MALSDLANILSDVANTPDQIRDILSDAGMLSNQVALDGSPFQMWRQALESAEGQSTMPALLSVMRGRYPRNTKLFDAELRYWTDKQLTSQASPGHGTAGPMWDLANQMTAMHVRLMYIERQTQALAAATERLDSRHEYDWIRASVLVAVSTSLSSFLTLILDRLI